MEKRTNGKKERNKERYGMGVKLTQMLALKYTFFVSVNNVFNTEKVILSEAYCNGSYQQYSPYCLTAQPNYNVK
jgi:hypothetical protein